MAVRHLFLALGAASAISTVAQAAAPMPFMPLGNRADAPKGYVAMCARDPQMCADDESRAAPRGLSRLNVAPEPVPAPSARRFDWDRLWSLAPLHTGWERVTGSDPWRAAADLPALSFTQTAVALDETSPAFPFADADVLSGLRQSSRICVPGPQMCADDNGQRASADASLMEAPHVLNIDWERFWSSPAQTKAPVSIWADKVMESWTTGRREGNAMAAARTFAPVVTTGVEAYPAADAIVQGAASPAPSLAEAKVLPMLRRINRSVNGRVQQRSDDSAVDRGERWNEVGKGRWSSGDCEDLALQKRRELLEAGFPAERLFLAVAYVRGVGLHTVLVGRTGKGDFVMDSRTPYVTHWSKVGYSWLRVQSAQRPSEWRLLGRSASVHLAAARPLTGGVRQQ